MDPDQLDYQKPADLGQHNFRENGIKYRKKLYAYGNEKWFVYLQFNANATLTSCNLFVCQMIG